MKEYFPFLKPQNHGLKMEKLKVFNRKDKGATKQRILSLNPQFEVKLIMNNYVWSYKSIKCNLKKGIKDRMVAGVGNTQVEKGRKKLGELRSCSLRCQAFQKRQICQKRYWVCKYIIIDFGVTMGSFIMTAN